MLLLSENVTIKAHLAVSLRSAMFTGWAITFCFVGGLRYCSMQIMCSRGLG
jgi:hypothetical protein